MTLETAGFRTGADIFQQETLEMYGMVNKALEDMITIRFGEDVWEEVKQAAGVDIDMFLSNESYPDNVTYQLVGAASAALGKPAPELLEAFGVHWVLNTAREGYGDLMDAGGKTLDEFLINLPNFHTRVTLIFPYLQPPRFTCTDITKDQLRLHYYSSRAGLAPFVVGLLKGLGEMFATPVQIRHVAAKGDGADHDEFLVAWNQRPPA